MRFLTASTMAIAIVAGVGALSSVPAFAGADDGQTKAFWGDSAGPAAPTDQNGRYVASHKEYLQVEPRDAKAAEGVGGNVDADNVYFRHAKGTMDADSSATYDAPTTQNGRYTASYQQYMAVDPRDAKVDENASQNVDGSNIYFNHAKGTMSGN